MAASDTRFGNPKISEQPTGIRSSSLSKFRDDPAHLWGVKTIEEEMGDDQIIPVVRRPRSDVVVKKRHPAYLVGSGLQNPFPGQSEHSLAAIDAVDSDQWLAAKKRGEKSSIPLAHDQGAARGTDRIKTSNPGTLQGVPENDGFQRPVPRRDRIKAHNADAMSTTIGVSKTRSASAVRRSSLPSIRLSHPTNSALAPAQTKNERVGVK